MVCSLAENVPLRRLRSSLGLAEVKCHSTRTDCFHGLVRSEGDWVLGIPGAALGYCQALFRRTKDPALHTEKISNILQNMGAPWFKSHELFWGYRNGEPASEYLQQAMKPLLGDGRVPILITGLDPLHDEGEIAAILSSEIPLALDETMLIRLVLKSDESIMAAYRLIKKLVAESEARHGMPQWWPLLQGDISPRTWEKLRSLLGELWAFVNLAVNPFTIKQIGNEVAPQVTVAQFVLGPRRSISADGLIRLDPAIRITGAPSIPWYSFWQYVKDLQALPEVPTLIVLGPTQESWTDDDNTARLADFIPLLCKACEKLWHQTDKRQIEAIWSLTA